MVAYMRGKGVIKLVVVNLSYILDQFAYILIESKTDRIIVFIVILTEVTLWSFNKFTMSLWFCQTHHQSKHVLFM